MDINGKKVLVLGGGESGLSAAFLAQAKGADVTLLDSSDSEVVQARLAPLRDNGVHLFLGKTAEQWRGEADLVVISPGIPLESPLHLAGVATGAPCWSELAFGASFLDVPMLAVTGTNGKTTTTEMLQHSLRAGGKRVVAGGNIGLPMSDLPLNGRKYDYIVTEVSSFQMEHPGEFSPRAAALLNVTPDHLNRHKTLEAYTKAKLNLFEHITEPKRIVVRAELLRENSLVAEAFSCKECLTFSVDSDVDADYVVEDDCLVRRGADGGKRLLRCSQLPWRGRHNLENALATLAMEEAAGLDPADYALFLVTFQIGPHRLQTIAEIGGIRYVDDSKATDVDAMTRALETLGEEGRPIALIAGGLDKGCSLEEAIPALRRYVTAVFCIGACGERLVELWGKEIPATRCKGMEDAVRGAREAVRNGGIVLLSPGCASMDMFPNYAERGNFFKKTVFELHKS